MEPVNSKKDNEISDKFQEPKNVLIIDDDHLFLESFSITMELLNYNVIKALGGIEGVKVVNSKEHKLDAVFLDLMMPDLSGEEVFRIIRSLLPKTTKIVLQSGIRNEELEVIMKDLGADYYLSKPCTIKQIKEAMKIIGMEPNNIKNK